MDDLDKHLEALNKCQNLKESDVRQLCSAALSILDKEDNVYKIPAPCTIVGDIHGQLFDLL